MNKKKVRFIFLLIVVLSLVLIPCVVHAGSSSTPEPQPQPQPQPEPQPAPQPSDEELHPGEQKGTVQVSISVGRSSKVSNYTYLSDAIKAAAGDTYVTFMVSGITSYPNQIYVPEGKHWQFCFDSTCTLKAQSNNSTIIIGKTGSIRLINAIVEAGVGSNNLGGAICTYGGSIALVRCTIDGTNQPSGNYAGGAIYQGGGSTMELENCTIKNTKSQWSAAINADNTTVKLKNCTISGCSSSDGGIINIGTVTVTLENTTIKDCTAHNILRSDSNFANNVYKMTGSSSVTGCNATSTIIAGDCSFTMDGTSTIISNKAKQQIASYRGSFTMSGSSKISENEITNKNNNHGLYIKGNVTLKGNALIEDLTNAGGALTVDSGAFVMESGATIQDCRCDDGTGGTVNLRGATGVVSGTIKNCTGVNGGAIHVEIGSTLNLNGAKIEGCKSSAYGGAVYLDNATATINGTIKNCECNGDWGWGGAIYGKGTGALTLNNATIENCKATGTGGAVVVADRTSLSVSGCTITGCSAKDVGGLVCYTYSLSVSNTTISNCTATAQYGGAIFFNGATTATISGCTITNCTCAGHGGAIWEYGGKLTLTGTTFKDCVASNNAGGALFLHSGSFTITGCTFTGCSAPQGGAIHFEAPSGTIQGVTIDGCKAGSLGGGIKIGASANVTIKDCAIRNCSSGSEGGGLKIDKASACNIDGCVIENCSTVNWGGGICISSGNASLTKTTVSACSCNTNGGGIAIGGTSVVSDFSNCYIEKSNAKWGGGLYVHGRTVTANNLVIDGCSASVGGGGVTLQKNSEIANFTITGAGSEIRDCEATDNGAGVAVYGGSKLSIIDGASIFRNTCVSTNGAGGGVWLQDASSFDTSAGAKIWANKAGYGGGVYSNGTVNIGSASFKGNAADNSGGTLYINKGTTICVGETLVEESNNIGIHVVGGTLSITDGSYNTSLAANGGTIQIEGGYFLFAPEESYMVSGLTTYQIDESANPYKNGALFKTINATNVATITFHENRAQKQSYEAKKYTENYTVPDCIYTADDFEFVSWNTSPNGAGVSYSKGTNAKFTGSVNLYAQWKLKDGKVCTVTLKDTSNSNMDYICTAAATKVTVVNPYFSRPNYRFMEFNTMADGTGTTVKRGDTIDFGVENTSATLYAQWKALTSSGEVTKNTIVYKDPSGQNKDFTFSSTLSEVRIISASFKHKTLNFDCWNTEPDGSGINYALSEKYNFSNGGLVLYAQWKEKNQTSQTNKKITEYDGTNDNSIVDYYNQKVSKEDKPVEQTEGKYRITYKDLFGNNSPVTIKTNETKLTVTAAFTRNGYKLTGFSNTLGGSAATYKVGDKISVTNNPTIYAVWESDGSQTSKKTDDSQKQTSDPSYDPTEKYKDYNTIQNAIAEDTKTNGDRSGIITNNNVVTGDNTTTTPTSDAYVYLKDYEIGEYYYQAALWAREQGICNGTGVNGFDAKLTCSRGMIVTFLWRYAGCPEPSNVVNEFRDVNSSDFYYKAVLWAREKGITTGTSSTTFSPNAGCTRAQSLTFLYRYEGAPSYKYDINSIMKDVPNDAYYAQAVTWGGSKGITSGVSSSSFAPNRTCSRGEIVTFLYRYNQTK